MLMNIQIGKKGSQNNCFTSKIQDHSHWKAYDAYYEKQHQVTWLRLINSEFKKFHQIMKSLSYDTMGGRLRHFQITQALKLKYMIRMWITSGLHFARDNLHAQRQTQDTTAFYSFLLKGPGGCGNTHANTPSNTRHCLTLIFCWLDQALLELPCSRRSSILTQRAWARGFQISVSRFQISTFAVAAKR